MFLILELPTVPITVIFFIFYLSYYLSIIFLSTMSVTFKVLLHDSICCFYMPKTLKKNILLLLVLLL